MEPVTIALIATTAVNALVPFFKKGAEKLVDKSAEEVFNKRSEIWNKVKGLFAADELTTLKLFEANPEDVETQAELRGELKHLLKANPETAKELDELLKQLPAMQAKQNTIDIKGNDNIAVQNISGSKIEIKK